MSLCIALILGSFAALLSVITISLVRMRRHPRNMTITAALACVQGIFSLLLFIATTGYHFSTTNSIGVHGAMFFIEALAAPFGIYCIRVSYVLFKRSFTRPHFVLDAFSLLC